MHRWGWDGEWDDAFWAAIGLADLAEDNFARIGSQVIAPGARVGSLSRYAAIELGLDPESDVAIAVPMIDAHSGAFALIDSAPCSSPLLEMHAPDRENRLAVICGTSTCHIAVTNARSVHVPGVWGAFRDAVYPGYFVSEGGQSATGCLLDYMIEQSSVVTQLRERAANCEKNVYQLLEELDVGNEGSAREASVHVLPYCTRPKFMSFV
jgi:ribulose kinase